MEVEAVIAAAQAGWQRMPGPADPAAIAVLPSSAAFPLPAGYLALLRLNDGGEGKLGDEPSWFRLWPAAEVLAANGDYQLPEFPPGFLPASGLVTGRVVGSGLPGSVSVASGHGAAYPTGCRRGTAGSD